MYFRRAFSIKFLFRSVRERWRSFEFLEKDAAATDAFAGWRRKWQSVVSQQWSEHKSFEPRIAQMFGTTGSIRIWCFFGFFFQSSCDSRNFLSWRQPGGGRINSLQWNIHHSTNTVHVVCLHLEQGEEVKPQNWLAPLGRIALDLRECL